MRSLFFLLASFVLLSASAQINVPAPSPLGKVEQKVGLTDISVEYSRPSVKDRDIFGSLVPYNEMWRTGANASTKLTISDSAEIGGEMVPAGTYALYTIPGEEEWTIILHKNLSYHGTGGKMYKTEEDQLRFKVKASKLCYKVETLTINFTDLTPTSCNLEITWDNVSVSFPIIVNYDAAVMLQIEQAMTISQSTYYQAARYYLENDKDMEQALEWINLALENNEKYWIMRQKALILAKLERYDEAIEAAKLSMNLAKEAGNNNYVEINQASIDEWSK